MATRYDTLADLLPIRADLDPQDAGEEPATSIRNREIVLALFRHERIGVSGLGAEDWMRRHAWPFPYTFGHTSQLDVVRKTFELPLLDSFVGVMQSAHKLEAEALSRPIGEPHRFSPKLSDLPDSPVDLAEAEDMWRTVERTLDDPALLQSFSPYLSAEQLRRSMEEAIGPIRQMMRRAGEVGARRAYAEAMGISAPDRDRRRLDQVGHESLFADRVRSVAHQILQIDDPATVNALVAAVRAEDCPGTWLSGALEAEIQRAEHNPDPGNAFDLEHTVHLPHVDVFTADKRIARYICQVLDRGGVPAALEGAPRPVAAPKDIDALRDAVISARE
jgi:hypothetical protein